MRARVTTIKEKEAMNLKNSHLYIECRSKASEFLKIVMVKVSWDRLGPANAATVDTWTGRWEMRSAEFVYRLILAFWFGIQELRVVSWVRNRLLTVQLLLVSLVDLSCSHYQACSPHYCPCPAPPSSVHFRCLCPISQLRVHFPSISKLFPGKNICSVFSL